MGAGITVAIVPLAFAFPDALGARLVPGRQRRASGG